jgi:hypothetical protein
VGIAGDGRRQASGRAHATEDPPGYLHFLWQALMGQEQRCGFIPSSQPSPRWEDLKRSYRPQSAARSARESPRPTGDSIH